MEHLKNIVTRVERAAEILKLEPWLLNKLTGFKMRWSCDIQARMDDGSLKQFRAVRIWHRSPHTDQPHKGGMRYHPDVNEEIMLSHAMEMSWKCWLMGLEWGGAKGGVAIDPLKYSAKELKNVTESLVDEMNERNILGPFRDVPAPDVGTGPREMNWIRQRYAQHRRSREDARFAGVVTGKPVGYGFGGMPGRNEATGYGLITVLDRVLRHYCENKKFDPLWLPGDKTKLNIAIMGFGNVGSHAAQFAADAGYKVIAASDVNGGVYNKHGLNIASLLQYAKETKSVFGAPGADQITNDELLQLADCDILVPAALENVITRDNVDKIKARVILEGANGPTTPAADDVLQANNVLVIPDILANAGGVTVSFFEWARNVNIRDERVPLPEKTAVLDRLHEMMNMATQQIIENAKRYNTSLRNAAYITAIERTAPLFRAKHQA